MTLMVYVEGFVELASQLNLDVVDFRSDVGFGGGNSPEQLFELVGGGGHGPHAADEVVDQRLARLHIITRVDQKPLAVWY